jgi:hypothetical protein
MRKLATMILAMIALWTVAFASRVIQMSFEEAARTAAVVVLGTLMESEEFGTVRKYSTGTTMVVRKHRFHVDEYLKGDGPSEIVVETLGGKYKREIDGKQSERYESVGGQPQLPEEGTAVVLFLTPFGAEGTFMISSASAGWFRSRRAPTGRRS